MEDNNFDVTITNVEKVPMKNSDFFRYKFSLDIGSEDCVNAYINCDNQYGSYVYFEEYKSKNEGTDVQIPFNKIKEDAISTVLNEVLKIDELSEWARKVMDSHDMVADQIIKSGFAKEQKISLPNGSKLGIMLCSYGEINDLSDIDYYMTDNESIDSDESLYRIAENIVNEEKTKELIKESKEKLFSFYQDEDIEYLMQRPYDLLSEKEIDTLSFFSDWHKDTYGYRPRGLANECQYRLTQERIQNNDDEYEHE